MKRYNVLVAIIFLAGIFSANAQNVNGKLKSTGNADLHVIRLYADSFPKVSLTFHAVNDSGNAVWNLQQKDVRVTENGRVGEITSFKLLSADQHLQTMLVIDHSGSMNRDFRYYEWYNKIDWDTIPGDTVREYLSCPCNLPTNVTYNDETTYSCPCQYVKRDTMFLYKHEPVNPDYKSPLWYAKEGAKVFLKSMSPKDGAGLVSFSDVPDLYIDNAKNDDETFSQIDNINGNGATAFYDALDQSLNHLVYYRGLRVIVALTDGKDNSSKMKLDALIAKAKKMHCAIYIIGLGDVVDNYALTTLTNETGGELFLTNDASKLSEVFLKMSRKLQAIYELVYESPFLKSSDSTHGLRLRFDVDSMYLNTQLIDLPLPESVITHLQEKEKAQNDFQQTFPLVNDSVETTNSLVNESAASIPQKEEPSEFPYETLGVTLLVIGAGTLIYRKTKRKPKQPTLTILKIFPNPSSGFVNVNYQADTEITGLRLVVSSGQGAEVYSEMISTADQTAGINLENLADGIYFIRLESAAGISGTEEVVIRH